MSNGESNVPERLRLVGATDLERRMLDAAGREQPSRELSERMARAIGVTLPREGAGAGDAGNAPAAPAASSSTLAWVAGALVTAAVAVGVVLATRSGSPSSPPPAEVGAVAPVSTALAPATTASALTPPVEPAAPPAAAVPSGPPPSSPLRGSATTALDLSEQIALLDAARGAIGRGQAERALGVVRKYQAQYPSGAFRPEAAAIRIDALMKLGRTAEARTLAERFSSTYGPGPLADRVARSAGLGHP